MLCNGYVTDVHSLLPHDIAFSFDYVRAELDGCVSTGRTIVSRSAPQARGKEIAVVTVFCNSCEIAGDRVGSHQIALDSVDSARVLRKGQSSVGMLCSSTSCLGGSQDACFVLMSVSSSMAH